MGASMAPYAYRVTCEPAGHPGMIYHVRVWLARPSATREPDGWTLVWERQIDAGQFPGQPRKQWQHILLQLKF